MIQRNRCFLKVILFSIITILLSGCGVKSLELKKINSVNYTTNDAGNKQVQANVTFYNPNKAKFLISDIDVDVLLGDKFLGKLKAPDSFVVEKESEFSTDFYIDIEPTALIKSGVVLLKALAIGEIELTLKGNIKVKYFIFDRNIPIQHVERVKLK